MQKLIMPFERQMMLCGYKNAEYKKYWGYHHYGADISTVQGGAGDDHTIYASGDGVVAAVGKDDSLGWGIAVIYKDCLNHRTGEVYDLTARYMHMSEVYAAAGQTVRAGTPLAPEGREGTGDYHLHIEFDTDVKYPQFTPQVKGGAFWKKGNDTTVNPSHILHVGEGQAIVKPTYNPAWLNAEDLSIPAAARQDGGTDYEPLYRAAEQKLKRIAEILSLEI